MSFAALGIWACLPVLLYIIYTDLSDLRIPNAAVMVLMIIFAATQLPVLPLQELMMRVFAATAIFGLCLIVFALHLLGGGDVKLLPAVVLFVPSTEWAQFVLALSVSVILTLTILRWLRGFSSGGKWKSVNQTSRYPLGPAIALAGLVYKPLGAVVISALSS